MLERIPAISRRILSLLFLLGLLYPCTTPAYAADTFDIKDFTLTRSDGVAVVHIPAGVHHISSPLLLASNTILEGEGQGTVLEPSSDFHGERFISNTDFTRGNKNIIVRALKVRFDIRSLQGDAPGVLRFENTENLNLANVIMDLDTTMYGIDLSASIRNASVDGCVIRNTGGGGAVQVRNRNPDPEQKTSGIRITNNDFATFGDEPVALFGWLGKVSDVLAEKNRVSADNASFGITAYGIDTPAHTGMLGNVRILGNSVRGGRHGAIGVKGGASDVLLSGNTISDTQSDGIFLDSGGKGLPHVSRIKITGNTLKEIGRHGIYAAGADMEITGNVIAGCKGAGIYVCELRGGRIDVKRNNICRAAPCILIDGKMLGSVSGNTLDKTCNIRHLK